WPPIDFSGRCGLCGVKLPEVSGSSSPLRMTSSAMCTNMEHGCRHRNRWQRRLLLLACHYPGIPKGEFTMRTIHALPLAAAMLLAACGGGETDADGDGSLTADEVAAAAADMVQPRPGQYRSTLELLEFDAPGVPDSAKQQMRQIFASGLTEGNTFCLTPEDAAANGARQMVENMAESDCTMDRFDVTGGAVVAEMQCAGEGGAASTVKMEGQMTTESSTMTMDTSQNVPNIGETRMKMRVTSQRIGDCP